MAATVGTGEIARASVDHIPVQWVLPPSSPRRRPPLALWLPHLAGTKENYTPVLQQLAEAGFVAVSLDPWQHGERGTESREQITERVLGDFRRQMWPILGQTTLDCLRVLDWATAEFDTGPEVVAGGVSMGGDIAVALAGIDQRVTRVGVVVSTPDWTRPGMRDLTDPARVLPQGRPGAYAQWFYDRLDPLTHLDAYAHGPAITFECGADDTHVPPDGALRFQAALRHAYPDSAERVAVNLHPGLGHLDGARSPELTQDCLARFLK